jgi:hypothetical protein
MKIPTTRPATVEHVNTARERIIRTRPSHLDSLVRRLREPQVRRVLEPVLADTREPVDLTYVDDLSCVRNLGLVAEEPGGALRTANAIYAEVIGRALTDIVVRGRPNLPAARDFVRPGGRFDIPTVLAAMSS